MSQAWEMLLCLLSLALLLFILMALASPLEALRWWSGWSRRRSTAPPTPEAIAAAASDADFFVVYLTAIGGISAAELSRRERGFLDLLQSEVPTAAIIDDVYPFSVTNNPLNGERLLAWLWQRLHASRLGGRPALFAALIFVRNLLQVAVSGDPRYGPIYNVGVAREIALSLLQSGYRPGSGKPISVMGWSGGGQIAAGVAPYLQRMLDAPIYIVSVGGVITNEPGVASARKILHLQGSRDKFPSIGAFLYPGRWPIWPYSAWNQARRDGRITVIVPGPMRHTGRGDYFDFKQKLPDGRNHAEQTAALVGQFIRQQQPEPV
jgi:hypothetical protein